MRLRKLSNNQAEVLAISLAKKLIDGFNEDEFEIRARPNEFNLEKDGKTFIYWIVIYSRKGLDGPSAIKVDLETNEAKFSECEL